MKSQAVIIEEQGAPSVMAIKDVDVGAPGPDEVLLEQTAIGLNYMDVYQRSGYYSMTVPSGLGLEAVGKVLAVGSNVSDVKPGDRVAYGPNLGAYALHRTIAADRVVPHRSREQAESKT